MGTTSHRAIEHTVAVIYLRAEAQGRLERLAAILESSGRRIRTFCARVASISALETILADTQADLVFSAADHLPEGPIGGGRVNVHSWLEERGIPFVGSPGPVLDLALSKPELKRRWIDCGIPTPSFVEVPVGRGDRKNVGFPLSGYPCIVKPPAGGNSRGIDASSVAGNEEELGEALSRIGPEEGPALVEAYLGSCPDFREITCACVGNGVERVCSPAEILLPEGRGSRVVTTVDKKTGVAKAAPVEDAGLAREAAALGARIFSSLGVQDYARCDLAFADGGLWAIEANGQPMLPEPWFNTCMRAAGLSEQEYLSLMVESALERTRGLGPGSEEGR